MRIEAITPVHIGDGEEIIPWEYSLKGSVIGIYPSQYIISSLRSKLFGLRLRNTLLELRDMLREEGFKKNFGDFLREKGINIEPLYAIERKTNLRSGIEYRSIKSFIKSVEGVYIPGSEVKGALRTIFVFGVLRKELKEGNNRLFMEIREIIDRTLKEISNLDRRKQKKEWDKASARIEALVLREGSKNKEDAKYDIFKAVRVSDSSFMNPSECLYVDSAKVIGSKRATSEPAEFLKPGVSFEIEISIDESIKKALSKNMKNPYIDLLNMDFLKESALRFYKLILSIDRDFFRRYSSELRSYPHEKVEEAINRGDFVLRIGKHQGFLSITLMQVLFLGDKQLYENLYRKVVPKFSAEVNKTRKVTSEGEAIGWCKLI